LLIGNANRLMVGVARSIHVVSSVWVFILALVILADVIGRVLFNQPLEGTKEILQNSVIAVTFLQIPLAIYTGSMLKTTMFSQRLSPLYLRLLRTVVLGLGAAFFFSIAYATWEPALEAVRIGEYEGEGSLRIYTWPVRFLMVATSVFAAWAYLTALVANWFGTLTPDDGLRDL